MFVLVTILSTLLSGTPYVRADYLTASGWTKARKSILNKYVAPDGTVQCVYGGESVDPHNIDIDHVIPLKYAHEHGIGDSSSAFKQKLGLDTANMLPVCAHDNRSKGDKGPVEFMPEQNKCIYAQKWLSISTKYRIHMDVADKKLISATLASCKETK